MAKYKTAEECFAAIKNKAINISWQKYYNNSGFASIKAIPLELNDNDELLLESLEPARGRSPNNYNYTRYNDYITILDGNKLYSTLSEHFYTYDITILSLNKQEIEDLIRILEL